MASNAIFIALGIQDNYLEKTMLIRSTLSLGSYKTFLDTSPPPRSLSLHCKQINKVKNELDDQPSSLLARMHVSNYKATFSPIHLVFLKLGIHQPPLDFKTLDEKNNGFILRTFYPQLLNKNEYIRQWNQNLSRFRTYGGTKQSYRLHKLSEIETYFLDEIDAGERIAKKWNDSI